MSLKDNKFTKGQPQEVKDPERRKLLGWMIAIFNGVIGIAVIGPVIGFVGAPLKAKHKPQWVDVIGLDELIEGETKEVSFDQVVKDGFQTVQRTYNAFMKRSGDSVVAFKPACTHLGCRVKFQDKKQRYFCPCHGAVFDNEGERVSGPQPRALDQYETKVENGRVFVLREV